MISYDDVVGLLTAACPGYQQSEEHALVDEADGEYVRVAGFVLHLIRLLDEGDTANMAAVFGVVEWVLQEAEPAAADLVQAGFLEDLVDHTLYDGRRVRPVDFGRWLGPLARSDPRIQAVLADENL
jgi:hypothetical protein